jgi:hypothetical protein
MTYEKYLSSFNTAWLTLFWELETKDISMVAADFKHFDKNIYTLASQFDLTQILVIESLSSASLAMTNIYLILLRCLCS